jgi:hypothetical protein
MTIREYGEYVGLTYDRALDYDNDRDLWAYPGVISFHRHCPDCGAGTSPLDPAYPDHERVCLRCILSIVEYMNDDKEENDSEDVQQSLQESIGSLNAAISVLKADLITAKRDVQKARADARLSAEKLGKAQRINTSMSEECDALRKRVTDFDDDSQALQNDNARLRLEVEKWKKIAASRGG